MTPKTNRKAKVTTNKRGREIEQESPSSPLPAPKKGVDMISWGQNSNTTDEIKSQTEGKIRFEISVATELWLELGRYVATEATELWLGLGCYAATGQRVCVVITQQSSLVSLV